MTRLRSFRFGVHSIPYLFALITITAYGLFFWETGFYWDDWVFAWIAKFLGPQEFFRAFAGVRPFLEPIFFVTTSLIPPVPIYWQIFALLIRCLSGWLAWFVFSQVWPDHKQQALVASLLFLVFPGYSQHWVAFTHINQEWIPFIFYIMSFGFTVRALRNPAAISKNTTLALVLTVAGILPTEYFLGLEPLRGLFIWVIVSEKNDPPWIRAVQTLKYWTPYLLIWLGNAAWLTYFYTIGSYDSYSVTVAQEPFSMAGTVSIFLDALWKTGLYIWVQIVALIAHTLTAPSTQLTIVLIIASFLSLFFYFKRLDIPSGNLQSFAGPALCVGVIEILFGRVPSFAAGLPLTLQSTYDRFMISMMLGGCLFITGLIGFTFRDARIRTVISVLLIALGIGQQFYNANSFRRDWEKQQEIIWQLKWRAPGLQPNTVLLTNLLPLDYETDLSFTAPINWMYRFKPGDNNLDYGIIFSKIRLGGSIPALQPNIPINIGMRGPSFHGSTSQALVIYMPKSGCLRILDPALGDQYTYAGSSEYLVDAIPLSDPNLIITNDDNRIMEISFLKEPEHQWCYYYVKMELARQQKDWKKVIQLMNEANALGYQPGDTLEWLPFIEAQASTGNFDLAENLSTELLKNEKRIGKGLCQVWKRVLAQSSPVSGNETRILSEINKLQCE